MTRSAVSTLSLLYRAILFPLLVPCAWLTTPCAAQGKPAPNPAPDVLVLSNGDTLHGKLVSEIGGKVTFHCDPLGDVSLTWDKIKELHATEKFALLDDKVKARGKKSVGQIPVGTVEVSNQAVTIHSDNTAPQASIPVKNALYIMDNAVLDKQLNHRPGFFTGWNGAATAGASIVTATQSQYTVSGAIGLVRVEPTVSWLNPRNRTSADLSGSFGKITQPGYTIPAVPATPTTPAVPASYVPTVSTKSAIFHVDAERDEYLSPRFFALGQTAFDHNYGQDLQLQQVYGGGIGWTAMKTPRQEVDVKGTIQYEKQQFISGAAASNTNLVGSTFAATYVLHLKLLAFLQGIAYLPAYNDSNAWSANETNTVSFPAYKNLSFSLGTMDSYLNNPPVSLPPTKPNSFQFTMGLTYAIKSKY
jgi:hypothetical protein